MIVYESNGVTLFKSDLFETVSVVAETSDLVLVADPSWLPREVEAIRDYVRGVLNGRPLYVLFTHSDYDHIIGAGAFEGAKTIASRAFRDKPAAAKEAVLEQIRDFDDGYYIARPYPILYPEIDHAFGADGETLAVGGTTLTFYQAQGHNDDGLFTVVEPLGLLIAGDYFSSVEFPYIYDSSVAYENSVGKLDRMLQAHRIGLLASGHGDPAEGTDEMIRRQQASFAYIRGIREAVEAGDEARFEALIEGHRFPRVKRKFHDGNRRLLERELGRMRP